jgi:hypothetical protein
MAKIKIKFTEDQVNLIKNLRFKQIKPDFFVDPCNDDVWIQNVGNGRFNIHNLIRKDKVQYANETFETVSPVEIHSSQDFGDNLYGLDTYSLWGGTYIYEDIAYIIGKMDKVVEGTLEDPDGPKFDEETTEYMDGLASFIIENLQNIEEILHQFCTDGIQPGVTYSCKPSEHIWTKEVCEQPNTDVAKVERQECDNRIKPEDGTYFMDVC